MTIRFLLTGTIPANNSGTNLSIGVVNGVQTTSFYAVDRRLSTTPTGFLVDNTASWAGTNPPNLSGDRITVTTAATSPWTPSGVASGNYVAVNKTIYVNGGNFVKAFASTANIYLINCTIVVNVTAANRNNNSCVIGCYPGVGGTFPSTDRAANFGVTGTNGSFNAYGCDIIDNSSLDTTSGVYYYYAFSDMVGCTFTTPMGGWLNNGQININLCLAGRYVSLDAENSRTNTGASGLTVYGAPAAFTNVNLDNIPFANIGQGTQPLFVSSPAFTFPGQTQYYQYNINQNQPVQVLNGPVPSLTATGAGSWLGATAPVGTTSGGAFLAWGGGGYTSAQAGVINFQTFNTKYYQDVGQTQGVKNVRFRTISNARIVINSANPNVGYPATGGTNNTYCDYLSSSTGLLTTEKYSTDGGATFNNGFINALSTATGTTQNATNWNSNLAGSAPDNTAIVVAQRVKPDPAIATWTSSVVNNYTVSFRSRSFTHNFDSTSTSVNYGTLTVPYTIPVRGGAQVAAQNTVVKSGAVTAMNATNNGIIDSYFLGRFPSSSSTADANDVHDAVRYEWFNYTTSYGFGASISAPIVYTYESLTFINPFIFSGTITINNGATGGTIATKGYTAADSNLTIRAQAILSSTAIQGFGGAGLTINLTSMATAPAPQGSTYATVLGQTINLAGSQTLYQPVICIAGSITNLLPAGIIAQGVRVGFGSTTAISLSGDASLVSCNLSGTLSLNNTTAGTTRTLTINGGTLTANLTINGSGAGAIQVANQGLNLNGFTLTVGGTATQVNSATVNIDSSSYGGTVLLMTSGGTILNTTTTIPSSGSSFTLTYPSSPAVDRVLIGNAKRVPKVTSVVSGSIDATGLVATQAQGTNLDTWVTTFAGGVTQFAIPASQTGSTAGVQTAANIVARFGDQAFLQGLNASLTAGNTVSQFINNNLSDTVTISTNLIQFVSSDATQQRTIGGIVFTGDWYVQGGTGNKTSGITGALGVPQIAVPLNNQSASIGDVYTAEAQVVNNLVVPVINTIRANQGVINTNVIKASKLIPASAAVSLVNSISVLPAEPQQAGPLVWHTAGGQVAYADYNGNAPNFLRDVVRQNLGTTAVSWSNDAASHTGLPGTWVGPVRDLDLNVLGTLSITIDANGHITSQSYTGTGWSDVTVSGVL